MMKRTYLQKNTNTDEQNTCEFHPGENSFNEQPFVPKDIQYVKSFIQMKSYLFIFFFLLGVIMLFSSCQQEENMYVAYGDAIVQSFKSGDSVVYATCYYAYSYEKMKQASVSSTDGSINIPLDSAAFRYTFSYFPDTSDYKTSKPSPQEFFFKVVFDNGIEYEATDSLEQNVMLPPVLTKNQFDTIDIRLNLAWNNVEYAHQYRVVLENEAGEVVFQSDFLSASQPRFSITSSSDGWFTGKIPVRGEKFRPVVLAYQYEKNVSAFDVQSISFAREDYFSWLTKID
ncbi:MAG: hypothetical protein GXX78_05870 [Bacteroidales bacterium]|nr:hypothetical protein [Bacteroidales bacterium]